MEEQDLDERLKCHSACFATMVELIPSKFYIVKDDATQTESRYWQNRKQKQPKQVVKEASKKAKKAWLDPSIRKSLQARKEESGPPQEDIGEGSTLPNGVDVEEAETVALQSQESKDREMKRGIKVALGASEGSEEGSASEPEIKGGFSVEDVRSGDFSELQVRLKARIADFRRKRKAPESACREVRKKRKKEARGEKKEKKKEIKKRVKQVETIKQAVIFSKIDVSAPSRDWKPPTSKKKDYRKLLAEVETKRKRLEETGESRREEVQEKLNWQKAVDMARGSKVKDDPKLLKKTVKRLEKKKKASRKKWDHRTKVEESVKQKRQEVKKKHIQKRIEQIKEKKQKKRAKKRGKH